MAMLHGYSMGDDIVAVSTPTGGALAVIRTSGCGSVAKVAAVFSCPDRILKAQGGVAVHGWIVAPSKKNNESISHGEPSKKEIQRVDEVVATVFRSPKSYTGEDMVEVSCHGGAACVNAVLRVLLAAGFRQAERGEYTLRSFTNNKMDLTEAESVAQLIASKTDWGRGHAISRLAGSLYRAVDGAKGALVGALSKIVVDVEYPEDERLPNPVPLDEVMAAKRSLQSLLATWGTQKVYRDGVKVAILGRTNAGKSSLFNVLLKEERAIVSPVAGTTRDYIDAMLDLGGVPIELFDTAGLRQSGDAVESAGIRRSGDIAKMADIVLYLVDATLGLVREDAAFLDNLATMGKRTIIVWNKCDKMVGYDEDSLANNLISDTPPNAQGFSPAKQVLYLDKQVSPSIGQGFYSDNQGHSPDKQGMSIDTKVSPPNKQVPSSIGQRLSSDNQGLSPTEQGYYSDKRGLSCDGQGFSFDNQELPPAEQGLYPIGQGLSPVNQGLSHIEQGFSPIGQGVSSDKQELSPNKQDFFVDTQEAFFDGQGLYSDKRGGCYAERGIHDDKMRGDSGKWGFSAVKISVLENKGIAELLDMLLHEVLPAPVDSDFAKWADGFGDDVPTLGNERQKTLVEDALSSIDHALQVYNQDKFEDGLIMDLEDAVASLGEITGEVTSDDILHNVFSKFCVGK